MLVKNWMSKDVITVDAGQSMKEAIYILEENRIKLLPVMEKDQVIGIISDRDLKKASPSEETIPDMDGLMDLISKIKVSDIMTKNPYTIPPDYTVEEAAAILMENKISGLPVIDEKKHLAGIITRTDIFKMLISLTGRGKKGLQIALRVKDKPGVLQEIKSLIDQFGVRTASILSSEDDSSEYRNLYFRIYQIDRKKIPALVKAIEKKGTLIYLIDFINNKRILR